ncbi:MAG: hypothetical protein ACT4P4_26745 [Betaproteobacteria bacterium]
MKYILFTLGILLSFCSAAAEFKKIDECVAGRQVTDRKDRNGVITGVANGMCRVKFAGEEKESSYLHWMLRPAGSSKVTADKLVNGVYKCYHSGGYAFIDIHIDGPNTYRDKNGKAGRYTLDAGTGKIVFESGTLKPASAKLFNGPKIGLNMDGKTVYSTTCDRKS